MLYRILLPYALRLMIQPYLGPVNAQCPAAAYAVPIIPTQIDGTSVGATYLGNISTICPSPELLSSLSRVAWFKFQGTGTRIYASTCNAQIRMDTRLIVVNTTDSAACADLRCIDNTDDYQGDICSTLVLDSDVNQFYFIGVLSFEPAAAGSFRLDLSYSPPAECALGAVRSQYLDLSNPYQSISGDAGLSTATLSPSCPLVGAVTNLTGSWLKIVRSIISK